MEFNAYLLADLRIAMLRLLNEMPERRLNSSSLRSALKGWAHDLTRQQVKTELRWLEDRGLVVVESIADGSVLIASLTERGIEVAAGRIVEPGVKRARD